MAEEPSKLDPDPDPDPGQWDAMMDEAERAFLARRLEAGGHVGCASDLEAADGRDVAEVAYAIAQHLEEVRDARREEDELLAQDIKEWADRNDRELRGHDRREEGNERRSR